MIPTVNTVSVIPPATTLVNTSVPGSIALRPPADSVAPSVSSAVIDNNARGNSTVLSSTVPGEAPAADIAEPFSSLLSGGSADGIASAQTNFFAQLIGQGGGEDAHALLVVYEKLVEIAQVRYKPSNADLPAPEPSGVYGRILQQEKQQVRTPLPADVLPQARPAQAAQTPIYVSLPVVKAPRDDRGQAGLPSKIKLADSHSYDVRPAESAPLPPLKATSAYVASQVRPQSGESKTLESA